MESIKPEGESFDYIDIDAVNNKLNTIERPKHIKTVNAPSRASRKICEGDTLFSMVRPYLKNIAYVPEQYEHCIASTGFYVVKPTKLFYPKYLYWLLLSPYVVDGLNQFMKGDNSPSINGDNVEQFLYPIPPIEEQKRIIVALNNLVPRFDFFKKEISFYFV
jgi:type I restriction enzyme S subunit